MSLLDQVTKERDHAERLMADLERQLAEERARIDCSTNNGWLSDDLECAGEDGPACWKHLLAEAQGKLKAVRKDAAAALEIAASDLEAVYACEQEGWLPSEGEKSPWEMARLAVDRILSK